jgi:peptide/nickel transport system substrate-binding protein
MFQKLNTYASTKGVTGMHITVLNDNPYELVKKA